MKYDILHVDNYLLIVEHALPNVGEVCLFRKEPHYNMIVRRQTPTINVQGYWRILAHRPLNGADYLDEIPKLPDLKVLDETVNSISEFNTPVAFELYFTGSAMFIPATQQTIVANNDWVGRYIYKEEEQ